jgi:hypothetical protein
MSSVPADPLQKAKDAYALKYDPKKDAYDLSKDPRCLWGWGPPECDHRFGHGCFRAFGHPGHCKDEVSSGEVCYQRRPADWDTKGREAINRGDNIYAANLLKTRRKCGKCNREFSVKKDGRLRAHLKPGFAHNPYNPGPYCEGSDT